jgi:hypothetical protein
MELPDAAAEAAATPVVADAFAPVILILTDSPGRAGGYVFERAFARIDGYSTSCY